jgi:hypothetical protein
MLKSVLALFQQFRKTAVFSTAAVKTSDTLREKKRPTPCDSGWIGEGFGKELPHPGECEKFRH